MLMNTKLVKHRIDGYVGVRDGTTRIHSLFESRHDSEGCRVKLPDGKIKIASPFNLIDLVGKEHVVEVHKQRLELRGIAYLGFRTPEKATESATHCPGCKSILPSSWDLECCACNAAICDCGTCRCGPKRKKKPVPKVQPAAPTP
jgi:hypothetical protein